MSGAARVRALVTSDLRDAAELHRRVLHVEFLSRFGPGFLRAYYRAWLEAPGAISLAALDGEGRLVGVLLGASSPATHVHAMVRRHGVTLGARLLGYALGHPPLLRDLIVTRARRYARALVRLALSRVRPSRTANQNASTRVVGEITHVLVDPPTQGLGVGRALVDAAIVRARASGVDELELVTPPDLAARHFYERLGWTSEGAMASRSGESFVKFRLTLREDPSRDDDERANYRRREEGGPARGGAGRGGADRGKFIGRLRLRRSALRRRAR